MNTYEKKYKEALERAKKLQETCDSTAVVGWCEYIFPELVESEDELTWLTKYIEEEAYSLSMDVRDNEDRIKLKKLQKTLAWLEKQGEKKVSYTTTVETGDGGINALVTRDIEIPFGSKDSELQEVTYYIPEGFHAEIEGDKVVIKKGEQKHAWSEEDEAHIHSLLDRLNGMCKKGSTFITTRFAVNQDIDWLKSLKQRIGG